MAFLTLNGVPVPVALDSGTMRAQSLGEYARSYRGRTYTTRRAKVAELVCRTPPLSLDLSNALVRLIEGDGQYWNLDNLDSFTSSRGLTSGGINGEGTVGEEPGKFGTCLHLTLGFPDVSVVTWQLGHGAPYTLSYWRKEGSTWHHYGVTQATDAGAATVYKDGEISLAGDPGVVDVETTAGADYGNLYVTTVDEPQERVDELVVLPYVAPAAWIAAWATATTASPWGQLRKLALGGDWLSGYAATGLGQVLTRVPVAGLGGAGGVGAVLEFELYGDAL